jgi:hypothetical protein
MHACICISECGLIIRFTRLGKLPQRAASCNGVCAALAPRGMTPDCCDDSPALCRKMRAKHYCSPTWRAYACAARSAAGNSCRASGQECTFARSQSVHRDASNSSSIILLNFAIAMKSLNWSAAVSASMIESSMIGSIITSIAVVMLLT